MPVHRLNRVSSSGRCAALGMALALSLGLAAPLHAPAAFAGELAGGAVDETVFPIGMPPAMIEATDAGQAGARLWRDELPVLAPDSMSTGAIGAGPITTSALMATPPLFRFKGSPILLAADRHILVGLMLLAVAAMASVSFGLWRWQIRGLHHADQADDGFRGGRSHGA